jgi:glycosyltransferase involved in cell wall biosynthesis
VTLRPTSVIICTHNRASLLPRIIGQLRQQNYPRNAFEIIVVDNRSTDKTAQIVELLAGEAGIPLRYVSESHFGISCARNRGALEARYPYLAYIDDDCTIGSNWLNTLMSGFDIHERVVAVSGLVLLAWDEPKPNWLGLDLEPWFADTSSLGKLPRLLDDGDSIVESNTAFEKRALLASGGFIGMEQFGSRNMAAGEILYLLHQLKYQGGKIAFMPEAVMCHHLKAPNRKRLLRRGYWQGVSDSIVDYLIHRRSRGSYVLHACIDLAAFFALLAMAGLAFIRMDQAKGMFHITRAIRRVGFILSELRIVGNWSGVQSWSLE